VGVGEGVWLFTVDSESERIKRESESIRYQGNRESIR
jgi:hypothetical protein